jgi:enoyl-CoA hydratase/carnithine racemase
MTVRAESIGDAVVLTLDRPDTRNAIGQRTAQRLGEAILVACRDPSVRGVVITAAGSETFMSGGDLKEFSRLAQGEQGDRAVLEMFEWLSIIEHAEIPVVAAIQGAVLGGGCEIALLCDLVVVEAHATFSFRHAKMGLSPAWGGLTRLVERVGPLESARLLFTAENIDAGEALRIGLVNEVVATGTSKSRAVARVARIADNPRTTVAAMKRTLREVREARRGVAVEKERAAFSERWGGTDHKIAMGVFFDKK